MKPRHETANCTTSHSARCGSLHSEQWIGPSVIIDIASPDNVETPAAIERDGLPVVLVDIHETDRIDINDVRQMGALQRPASAGE